MRSRNWDYEKLIRVASPEELYRARQEGLSGIRKKIEYTQICRTHKGKANEFRDRPATAITVYDVVIPVN
jgi:hypothetical protein